MGHWRLVCVFVRTRPTALHAWYFDMPQPAGAGNHQEQKNGWAVRFFFDFPNPAIHESCSLPSLCRVPCSGNLKVKEMFLPVLLNPSKTFIWQLPSKTVKNGPIGGNRNSKIARVSEHAY